MEINKGKIYTDKSVLIGTFLGGPLAGGYLIAENFKTLNQNDKVKKVWIITIITLLVIALLALIFPESKYIPKSIIPAMYSSLAYSVVKSLQEKDINEFIDNGGLVFQWWRSFLIGLIGLFVTLIPLLIFILSTENNAISTKKYGNLQHEIDFISDNITSIEIDNIALNLSETIFFNEGSKQYLFVQKTNNNYEISISVSQDFIANDNNIEPYKELRKNLQSKYPNNKVIFNLVYDDLQNVIKRIE